MFKRCRVVLQKALKDEVRGPNSSYSNMLKDPSTKYSGFQAIYLTDRTWPNNHIKKAPRWLATDLRDGNQSLPDPMSIEQKQEYFKKLVQIGLKEIEVSFPSASQTDFDFTRWAVKNAPEDVDIQVLVQSRERLIRRTIDSLEGAKRAIVHTYLATSDLFRNVVFGMSRKEALEKAVRTAKFVRSLTKDDASQQRTNWTYEFSPECFSSTPTEFAVDICRAVKDAWEPTLENPIIFNLPATIEVSTPNVYADQIEYFCRHIGDRDRVVVSLHCHNDRGCGVAATELGLLAGGDRIEGCLFGNGERTGNVDLVTLALNLYTTGISPDLDFSDMKSIIDVAERCNKIPVHPRAPYGGSLVTCAFSGSHQDAIKKGFTAQEKRRTEGDNSWQIPYLTLDPQDIGRNYEAVIRVNSQSGKGGAAWIVQRNLGLDLPKPMQIDFSSIVQDTADGLGRELKANEIISLLQSHYNVDNCANNSIAVKDYNFHKISEQSTHLDAIIDFDGTEIAIHGEGNGPISSFLNALSKALGIEMEVETYAEHSVGQGSKTKAATYVKLSCNGVTRWGIGMHESITRASVNSLVSCANSLIKARALSEDSVKTEDGFAETIEKKVKAKF
ncbi:2-isopropylmalate synthase (Alpha-isopropylmalate synthase) (Alpha-IPM synthetase) [Brettanomyces nanus]|uniref:2-isopropylmalate synthase n=1 Tax=Eeniella nana TaxID=13502 RepID=A0A875S0B0_EENNA|nr:2-isopropylmalate synthase (Alpha-isopropylmalate synthase) (Alpha-IPM synthetase) [Brettanomyces nanus]QPG72894.1 2-isopropylmalate synthase (Alpha-isopropylmalate synthase) (Alpha-IPM synthetase) [Brettanomyces nanus]